MAGSMVEVSTPDGDADAYLALPDADSARHGVLLLMDAFGLRPQIHEMANRIASRGYAVLAPNLFYRAGPASSRPTPQLTDPERRAAFFEEIRPLMEALTPERISADSGAYLDCLADQAPEPVALAGYCLGVRVAWQVAIAHPDRVAALAGFHGGRLVTEAPDSPHRMASRLQAEVYLGHADEDPSNTAEQIGELDRALEAAGVPYRSDVYSGAAHGYTMADTAVYDEQAAERHFAELFALLDRAL